MLIQGQQIGPYILLNRIGKGGFGEVWLAEKRSELITKKVAIKLPHEDQINIEAIRQEANLWEQASGHANVLPIIDADIYDGQIVIVSEYANGGSLHDKLKAEGTLPMKQAVEMTIGILNGLEFLHSKRIIHRDIKPQNILLQNNTPRLADFGISRAMQSTATSSKLIGTDSHMSPETFEGKRSVQTDIWAVGVVLYQLLTGRLPFPQEYPSERMFAIIQKDFEPIPNEIPQNLQNVIAKALAKLPENRYQTASDMRDDLQRFMLGQNVEPKVFARYVQPSAFVSLNPNANFETETETVITPNIRQKPAKSSAWLYGIIGVLIGGFLLGGVSIIGYFGINYFGKNTEISSSKSNSIANISTTVNSNNLSSNTNLLPANKIENTNIAANGLYNTAGANVDNSNLANSKNNVNVNAANTANTNANANPTPILNLTGTYTNKYGEVEISKFDSKGFTFDIGIGRSGCSGGIGLGRAVWIKPNLKAIYSAKIPDEGGYNDSESIYYKKKCTLSFNFSGKQVKISEDFCSYYHGGSCDFEGTYKR